MFFCSTRNQDQLMSLDIHIHLKRNKDPKLFRSSSKLNLEETIINHPELSEFRILCCEDYGLPASWFHAAANASWPSTMSQGGAQQKVVFFFEKLVFKAQEILFCFLILYSIFYAHLSRSTDSHQWHGVLILHVG